MIALSAANGDESKLRIMDADTEKKTAEMNQAIIPQYADKHFYSYWNKFRKEQPDVFE